MKVLFLILLVSGFASISPAQVTNTGGQSDLTIVKQSWSYKLFPMLTNDINRDIFKANDQQRINTQEAASNIRANNHNVAYGLPTIPRAIPNPAPRDAVPTDAIFSPPGYYLYELKVINSGSKPIKEVEWCYLFIDKNNNLETGRREFNTVKNISPGKSAKISVRSSLSPTLTVDALQGKKTFQDKYSEQILIKKIVYKDGSFWNAPAK